MNYNYTDELVVHFVVPSGEVYTVDAIEDINDIQKVNNLKDASLYKKEALIIYGTLTEEMLESAKLEVVVSLDCHGNILLNLEDVKENSDAFFNTIESVKYCNQEYKLHALNEHLGFCAVYDLVFADKYMDDYHVWSEVHNDEELGERWYREQEEENPLEIFIDFEKYGRHLRLTIEGSHTSYGFVYG